MSEPLTPEALVEMKERCARARRRIPGFPGYEADSDGTIWTCASECSRALTPHIGRSGYLRVRVLREGSRIGKYVHALVALAFLGERPTGCDQVRHLDGVRTNNAASNLRWGTAKENADDRERHGRTAKGSRNGMHTHPESRSTGDRHGLRLRPDKCGSAKLDERSVQDVLTRLRAGESHRSIARSYGMHHSGITRIATGRAYRVFTTPAWRSVATALRKGRT